MSKELTAIKSFSYGGRRLVAGQPFDARDADARLLVAIRKARYRTRDAVAKVDYSTRDMSAGVNYGTKDAKAGEVMTATAGRQRLGLPAKRAHDGDA